MRVHAHVQAHECALSMVLMETQKACQQMPQMPGQLTVWEQAPTQRRGWYAPITCQRCETDAPSKVHADQKTRESYHKYTD